MATQASSTTTGVGSSSAPMVLKILPCTRKDDVWQNFNLSKMSDNTTKAQCKLCFHLLPAVSNLTLRAHINNKYCDALKMVLEVGQLSMGRDGDLEEAIYDEEVKAGEAISLSDEEFTQDEASSEARSNGSEDEITFD
ncbi:hypothetical protein Tco_1100054 [Tanacetum coccineum]